MSENVRYTASNNIGVRQAQNFGVGIVGEKISSVLVHHDQANAGLTGDGAQYGFALAQGLLGVAQVGHISIGAEPTDDVALAIADGDGAREEPAVISVLAAQGKGVLPNCTARKAGS